MGIFVKYNEGCCQKNLCTNLEWKNSIKYIELIMSLSKLAQTVMPLIFIWEIRDSKLRQDTLYLE
jgi:hypothetical protein